MSNWIYREPVSGQPQLSVWLDVRLYRGGAVEIFPWVENTRFLAANPTNVVTTVSVDIGASTVFSQTIDFKHRTRIPLLSGQALSYWTVTDPRVTPQHDVDYLTSTRLVPNYGWKNPSNAALNGLVSAYSPNTLAGVNSSMGVAGTSGAILPKSQVMYLTSACDPRAFRAAIVFGLSSGSWSIHYRDDSTNQPIRFSSYPTASTNIQQSPVIPSSTGGTNGTDAITHLPSFGYLPFLITARWWFWEESAFWTTRAYLAANGDQRFNASCIFDTANGAFAGRGAAWALRTLAETLCLCPDSHPTFAEWKSAWENNAAFYRAKYVDGTRFGSQSFGRAWISPQGMLGEYNAMGQSNYPPPNPSSAFYGATWMQAFLVQVWGHTSNLGLRVSDEGLANHLAVRNHAYMQPVSRGGAGTGYNWRRFIVYGYPIGADASGLPVETWFSPSQSYSELLSGFRLAALPDTEGLTVKAHSSDTDLQPDASSVDFGSQQLSSLAFAVDHGAPGAADLWRKLKGASNFDFAFAGLRDSPEHAITPRS